MRYISALYDEENFVKKLAQMQLTGYTRVLKPLHDRRGLVAAAAIGREVESTFSAAKLRTNIQCLGLSATQKQWRFTTKRHLRLNA